MKTKKIPMRMCAVTRNRFEKKDLIRIVKTPSLEIVVDTTGKLNGRGVYFQKDLDVVLKAQKKDILSKVFDMNVDSVVYEEIKKYI